MRGRGAVSEGREGSERGGGKGVRGRGAVSEGEGRE